MAGDRARSADRIGIDVHTGLTEGGRETGVFQVDKWDTDQIDWVSRRDYDDLRLLWPDQEPDYRHFSTYWCPPFETYTKEDCNLITSAGWALALNTKNWIVAGSVAAAWFTVLVGRIGLGTGSTTPTYGDTALISIGALTTPNWVVCGAIPTYTAATGSTPASPGVPRDVHHHRRERCRDQRVRHRPGCRCLYRPDHRLGGANGQPRPCYTRHQDVRADVERHRHPHLHIGTRRNDYS